MDIRRRNEIKAESGVRIMMAEADIYVARIAHRLTVKLGPRFEMPSALLPREPDWRLATFGEDYAVWERVQTSPEDFEKDNDSDNSEDDFDLGELAEQVDYYNRLGEEDQSESSGGRIPLIGGDPFAEEDPPSIGSFYVVEEEEEEEDEDEGKREDEQQWM